jgi:histidyl-tRNA synthetase
MLRLKDTTHGKGTDLLRSAIRTASFYGFMPLTEAPARTPEALRAIRARTGNQSQPTFVKREERAILSSGKRASLAAHAPHAPLFLWHIAPDTKSSPATTLFELHVVGLASPIAEAILIVVAEAILKDAGVTGHTLAVNTLGSNEASGRFVRDIGTYLRKHLDSITPTLRQRAISDPLGTLIGLIERGHPAVSRSPQSMDYLSEEERRRFWELLEYLESFNITYELSPHVLGSLECWAHSLYRIMKTDPETNERVAIAFGGRYDPLASRTVAAPTAAAMLALVCESHGPLPSRREKSEKASLYLAHLGAEARRKGLKILETLRCAGIPVRHGLYLERMGDQMALAHRHAPSHLLVIGHKEAVDGTVIVRELSTNAQEAVPEAELAQYLRRHRVALA